MSGRLGLVDACKQLAASFMTGRCMQCFEDGEPGDAGVPIEQLSFGEVVE